MIVYKALFIKLTNDLNLFKCNLILISNTLLRHIGTEIPEVSTLLKLWESLFSCQIMNNMDWKTCTALKLTPSTTFYTHFTRGLT
jgi:hypothetical protein